MSILLLSDSIKSLPNISLSIFMSRTLPFTLLLTLTPSSAKVEIFCFLIGFSKFAGSATQLLINSSIAFPPICRTLVRKYWVTDDAAFPVLKLLRELDSSANGLLQDIMQSMISLSCLVSLLMQLGFISLDTSSLLVRHK